MPVSNEIGAPAAQQPVTLTLHAAAPRQLHPMDPTTTTPTPLERARARFDAARGEIDLSCEHIEELSDEVLSQPLKQTLRERAALALIAESLRDPDCSTTLKAYHLLGDLRAIVQQAHLLP